MKRPETGATLALPSASGVIGIAIYGFAQLDPDERLVWGLATLLALTILTVAGAYYRLARKRQVEDRLPEKQHVLAELAACRKKGIEVRESYNKAATRIAGLETEKVDLKNALEDAEDQLGRVQTEYDQLQDQYRHLQVERDEVRKGFNVNLASTAASGQRGDD